MIFAPGHKISISVSLKSGKSPRRADGGGVLHNSGKILMVNVMNVYL